jgi:hypothetical protein
LQFFQIARSCFECLTLTANHSSGLGQHTRNNYYQFLFMEEGIRLLINKVLGIHIPNKSKNIYGVGRIRTSVLQRPRLASYQARQRPPRSDQSFQCYKTLIIFKSPLSKSYPFSSYKVDSSELLYQIYQKTLAYLSLSLWESK